MKRTVLFASICFLALGCTTKTYEMSNSRPGYKIIGVSTDPTYGYSQENPIKVGGKWEDGSSHEHDYLYALRGPEGQELFYKRLGSCCSFETPNGYNGSGVLDQYQVKYKGIDKPVVLYLNMYDYDEPPKAPLGFTYVKY